MKTLQLALALTLASISTGCYTTTLVSGKPANPATIAYDARWHHGVVFGMGEVSGPYNLQEICPQGWAEIVTERSFLNSVVALFTSDTYSPQSVTIRCSGQSAMASAAAPLAPAAPPPAVPPPAAAPSMAAPMTAAPPPPPPPPGAVEPAPATTEPAPMR